MIWDDTYTDEPTHVRIFSDGNEYFIDGADDDGNYTEQCWSFDSHHEAVANIRDFVDATQDRVTWKWRISQNLRHDRMEEVES